MLQLHRVHHTYRCVWDGTEMRLKLESGKGDAAGSTVYNMRNICGTPAKQDPWRYVQCETSDRLAQLKIWRRGDWFGTEIDLAALAKFDSRDYVLSRLVLMPLS